MKALIGNAFLIGLAVASASVAACSFGTSTSGHPGSTSTTDDGTGSIGLQLTLAGGAQINSISYTVNGPNGATTIVTTGTVPVGNSTSIFFQTPDTIAPGSGYTITLTGGDDAGDTCLGTSAPFAVTARTSTPVNVELQCHSAAAGGGGVTVTGVTSNCATWNSISPSTSDIITGVADPVVFSAVGPALSSLAYTATVSGAGAATISPASGTLTAGAGSFNVTCTTAGLVTVSVVFSDGALPTGGSCDTTLDTVTFPVQCEGQPIFIDSGTPPVIDSGVDSGPKVVDSGIDSGPTVVDSGPNFPAICNSITGLSTCSPTALAFVEHDPSGACLKCLVNAGAVDDNFGDSDNECGDFAPTAAFPGTTGPAACVKTLDCILSTNVGNDNTAPNDSSPTGASCATGGNASFCYCGAGVSVSTCEADALPLGGVCANVEAAGLGGSNVAGGTSPTTIINEYTNVTLPSGVVNTIFTTAQVAKCGTCF